MKRWHAVAVGLVIYVVALIAMAPATLADGGLQRATEGRLRLTQAAGTLWSGAGQLEVRDAGGRSGIAKPVSWRVVPRSLLRGRLAFEVGLDQPPVFFPVTLTFSGIEIHNADISMPATVLGLGVPKLAPLGLTGEVQIRVANLSITRKAIDGTATLQWLGAGSTLTSVAPLGDYELRIDGAGNSLQAYLRSTAGPLWLDGKGSWKPGANPAFQANARIDPAYQEQLVPLLRLIAVERGEGRFDLQLN